MTILQKKNIFLHNHPKTLFFWAFFEIFFFHFFHVFSFSFSNIKKTKTKSAHFFSKTLFSTPWQTAKKYFRTPTHYLCFFKIPKKHYKTGEKQAKKNLGPSFDATLDQVLTQKTPNLGPGFDSTAHIYIYIFGLIWPYISLSPSLSFFLSVSLSSLSLSLSLSLFLSLSLSISLSLFFPVSLSGRLVALWDCNCDNSHSSYLLRCWIVHLSNVVAQSSAIARYPSAGSFSAICNSIEEEERACDKAFWRI